MSAEGPAGAARRRLVAPEDVGRQGLTLAFEADAAERDALARRLDLVALETLAAELRFEPAEDVAPGAIRVSGWLRARPVQRCVVTLEPVPGTLRESIAALYAPPPPDPPEREVEVPAEGDAPEPLPAEGIDAGELAAEHLALGLDPYPRHPDAPAGPLVYAAGDGEGSGDGGGEGSAGDDPDGGPFAALGQLKSKL